MRPRFGSRRSRACAAGKRASCAPGVRTKALRSELVHAIAKGPDDAIWAATSEGVARFDGQIWRMRGEGEDDIVACRGLARDGQDAMWVATAKGLRRITPADARAHAPGDVVVAGNMFDVRLDRFGRVWALSSASIALIDH